MEAKKEKEKAHPSLRIMTYNIRRAGTEKKEERLWNSRMPLVVKLIEHINPDIMGLQEAVEAQIIDLREKLPNFDSFGQSRGSSWWGMGTDEYNPIFYHKDKYELLANGTFSINQSIGWTPLKVRSTGWLPRICTWGKFKIKGTDTVFYVYNTHLDDKYEEARLRGLDIIKQNIADQVDQYPVILMGDFNAEFEDAIKQKLVGFSATKNLAKEVSGPQETRTGWDDKELKAIDHILINDPEAIGVTSYKVVQTDGYPSDHRPVVADILFKK
jgi:endonuclease/exonuclease/phosphatase family metal-dependent hydrolase